MILGRREHSSFTTNKIFMIEKFSRKTAGKTLVRNSKSWRVVLATHCRDFNILRNAPLSTTSSELFQRPLSYKPLSAPQERVGAASQSSKLQALEKLASQMQLGSIFSWISFS